MISDLEQGTHCEEAEKWPKALKATCGVALVGGCAGIGVVFTQADQTVGQLRYKLGPRTCHQADYAAAIVAIQAARLQYAGRVELHTSSDLLFKQVTEGRASDRELRRLLKVLKEAAVQDCSFTQVKKEDCLEAYCLAKSAATGVTWQGLQSDQGDLLVEASQQLKACMIEHKLASNTGAQTSMLLQVPASMTHQQAIEQGPSPTSVLPVVSAQRYDHITLIIAGVSRSAQGAGAAAILVNAETGKQLGQTCLFFDKLTYSAATGCALLSGLVVSHGLQPDKITVITASEQLVNQMHGGCGTSNALMTSLKQQVEYLVKQVHFDIQADRDRCIDAQDLAEDALTGREFLGFRDSQGHIDIDCLKPLQEFVAAQANNLADSEQRDVPLSSSSSSLPATAVQTDAPSAPTSAAQLTNAGPPFGVDQPWFPSALRCEVIDIATAELKAAVKVQVLIVVVQHPRNVEHEDDVEAKAVYRLLDPLADVGHEWAGKLVSCSDQLAVTLIGSFAGQTACVIKVPMGSTDAQCVMIRALVEWQPRIMVQVGMLYGADVFEGNTASCSSSQKQAYGDVVVSEFIVDSSMYRYEAGSSTKMKGQPYKADDALYQWAMSHRTKWNQTCPIHGPDGPVKVHGGTLVSGPLIVDQRIKDAMLAAAREANLIVRGGDMESAGLAAAAINQATPFIMIKGISDDAVTKGRHYQHLAAAASATFFQSLLQTHPGLTKRGK